MVQSSMAPMRRARKVNEKFGNGGAEESPGKEGPGAAANRSKLKKRKLADLVDGQWGKEELESFYASYRKYGKDWRKVSGTLCNRTPDMVEALYNMNRAYLSLPEGAATVAGLIAMMTDHYGNLKGNNSENESDEFPKKTSGKPPPKHGKFKQKTEAKAPGSDYTDPLSLNPVPSSFATPSVLNKNCSGGLPEDADTRPRAVRKRTPRFSAGSIQNRDSRKLGAPTATERQEEDGPHMAAMALAVVSCRSGGSLHRPSFDVASIKNCESEKNISKAVKSLGKGEGIIGSREDANKSPLNGQEKDKAAIVGKSAAQLKKSNKINLKGIIVNKPDDDQGDCNNIEGHSNSSRKGFKDDGDAALPAYYDRSQQLFYGDDESVFSALHTLADVSVNILQSTISKSESCAEVRDGNDESKCNSNEKQSKSKTLWKKDKRKVGGVNPDGGTCKKTKTTKGSTSLEVYNSTPKSEKGNKHNPTPTKMPIEEENVSSRKSKHTKQAGPLAESADKFANRVELLRTMTSPTIEAIDVIKASAKGNSVGSQTKIINRRKSGIVKAFSKRSNWHSEATVDKRPFSHPFNTDYDLKEKLSHALSNSLLRRWCRFEWFYGAIDYPWFVQNEFVEYLNFLQLGHMSRLTRGEWGFIRSSLPKPRRFSAQFLKVERNKLNLYRVLVRNYLSALRTGELVGHQTDLAHSLIVGQHVIARHPKSRELHNGIVLTVNIDSCKVQFDRPELGIEFVLDIDCMPLNLVRNVSEALRRIIDYANKSGDRELVVPENVWRIGASCSNSLENGSGSSRTAFSHLISALSKETKQHSVYSVAQAKATLNEAAKVGWQEIYKEPCTLSQIQEREADLQAIADFFRALNKKEALVMELRNMNEELLRRQENDSLSDSEVFKNQYAIVIAQLQEADVQVESAKFTLRERNTYNKDIPKHLSRSRETNGEPPDLWNSTGFSNNHNADSPLAKLMKNSRKKAKMMVDAAVQAMCSTNEGEQPDVKIEQALDSLTNINSGFGSSRSMEQRIPLDSGHASSIRENPTSAQLDPTSKTGAAPEGEITFPSELITSCVSTYLMIQGCTQEIHPPADMAHMLDLALASMQPRHPENAGLYRDIESAISKIKNMMLSIVPSPTCTPPVPVSHSS